MSAQILINEVEIGQVAKYNNLVMYRKFKTFLPELVVGGSYIDTAKSCIKVFYNEYIKDVNGNIIEELNKEKYYIVADVEGFPAFSNWLNSLSRTPINPDTPGIFDSTEYTLENLPIDIHTGYILQGA